jgi:hypothetical protein
MSAAIRQQPTPFFDEDPGEGLDPCEVLIDILVEAFLDDDAGERLPNHVTGSGFFYQAPLPSRPTHNVPASEAKIRDMAERYRLRQQLFHPADARDMGQALVGEIRDNGCLVLVERVE